LFLLMNYDFLQTRHRRRHCIPQIATRNRRCLAQLACCGSKNWKRDRSTYSYMRHNPIWRDLTLAQTNAKWHLVPVVWPQFTCPINQLWIFHTWQCGIVQV